MHNKKKMLQEGDIVYSKDSMAGLYRYTVDNTTPKFAWIGDLKFQREYKEGSELTLKSKIGRYDYTNYYAEAEGLKQSYQYGVDRTRILVKLDDIEFRLLDNKVLSEVISVVEKHIESANKGGYVKERATETEWFKWFYDNADYIPIDRQTHEEMKLNFMDETDKNLPEGYNFASDGETVIDR